MKLILVLVFMHAMAISHTEFKGNIKGNIKGKSSTCSVRIEQIYYVDQLEIPENFRADIVINLNNDHHLISHQDELFFTIKPGVKENIFSGMGTNDKDQVNLFTQTGTKNLESVKNFAVKWWHINHFHSAQCVNLQYVQE